VSLVSYDAPGPSFDPNTASQQTIHALASGTFDPGPHSLSVTLPDNYYQVDFVLGQAITQLGPAGSSIFYSAQGRLLSADTGAPQPVSPPTASLAGTVFLDATGSGTLGNGNPGLAGLTVTLAGTSAQGQPVNVTATTDASGSYSFAGLPPGTYTLT